MATETPKGVAEVGDPLDKEKEQIMATKDQAAPDSMPVPPRPAAAMGTNINWLEMMNKNMEAVHQATLGSVKYVSACQEATFTFMQDRMQKNQEMLRTWSEVGELPNLAHESAEFHRAAIEDYVRYVKNLADMTLAAVNDQIDPLEQRTRETLSTVSKAA